MEIIKSMFSHYSEIKLETNKRNILRKFSSIRRLNDTLFINSWITESHKETRKYFKKIKIVSKHTGYNCTVLSMQISIFIYLHYKNI